MTFTTTSTETAPALIEEARQSAPAGQPGTGAPACPAFPLGGSYTARFDRARPQAAVSGGNYTGGRRAAVPGSYVTGARQVRGACPAGSYTGTYDAGR